MALIYFKNKINFSSCYIKKSYTCEIRKKFLRKTNRELQFTLDKLLKTKEHYTGISMKKKI